MARITRKKAHNVVAMPEPAPFAPPRTTQPTASEIAERAFEIYCARGGLHGHDLDDWLQAERELQKSARSTAA
jgi:hypothetical protein